VGFAARRRLALAVVVSISLSAAGFLGASTAAIAGCPNEAARTGPSASLPDCRAYELVTPANKSSAVQDMDPSSANAKVSADGNRLALEDSVVQFGPRPTPEGSFSVFSRTSSGWQIESVPAQGAEAADYQEAIFDPDMAEMGVNSYTTTPISRDQLFQIGLPGGPYPTTIATTPTNYERPGASDFLAGATADFSRVFLESTDHALLSGSPTGTVEGAHDLYEWAGGALRRLVNVGNDGSLVSPCGAGLEAVSSDGLRVVFKTPDPKANPRDPGCEQQPSQLYMRVDGSSTFDVTEPNTRVEDPTGAHEVHFQGASVDGLKVFFTTTTELTRDDEGIHDEELYEYNASAPEGERLTRISRGTTGIAEGGVANEFVMVSPDGSQIYFYAKGKLTPDAQDLRSAGEEDQNVYRYDANRPGGGEIHYIATIREPSSIARPATGENKKPRPSAPSSEQVTPDGRFFVFVASDVYGSAFNNPQELDEIYRYDDVTGSLMCVSCPGNGAPAKGGAILTGLEMQAWNETPSENTVSEDGSYVFFQSNDELVPQDVNGIGGNPGSNTFLSPWMDVYEWHNGVISLISSGTSSQEAVLAGASATGSDVFFMTHSQLVPQDTDTSDDIYDARIDGGFAPPVETAACLGDTCLSPSVAPNDSTPATSVPGPGNPVPLLATPKPKAKPKAKRCAKGRVRRKRRCVKRRGNGKSAGRAAKHNRGGSK
jgi:hypothetical protein